MVADVVDLDTSGGVSTNTVEFDIEDNVVGVELEVGRVVVDDEVVELCTVVADTGNVERDVADIEEGILSLGSVGRVSAIVLLTVVVGDVELEVTIAVVGIKFVVAARGVLVVLTLGRLRPNIGVFIMFVSCLTTKIVIVELLDSYITDDYYFYNIKFILT